MKNRPFFAARTALAIAALAALSAAPAAVQALGVGRLNVQSALGEGMRAEIDLTSLTPEEAASLSVRVAPPEAYRAAGVDYNAVLAGTQASVVRRADGRASLRLFSDRAVQEPFIEVILELSWASGRLVREFTLLFDPPGSRNAPPVQATAPVAPVIGAAPLPPAVAAAAPPAATPAVPPSRVPLPPPPPRQPAQQLVNGPALMPAPSPTPSPAPSPAAPARTPLAPKPGAMAAAPAAPRAPGAGGAPASGGRYSVKPGDTLYRVAGRTQAGGVSLDQMLVGLYRANPEAFIGNNVNKLRSGSVLAVPTADEVRDVTQADMRRLITAQSVDFGAYRNRLAQGAPLAQAQEPGRAAQGKVQAAVDDRKQSAAPTPDKLKLSGAAASAAGAERKDNATRVAELSRNVEDLKKLQQGTAAVQAPAAAPPAAVVPPAPAAPPVAPPAAPPAAPAVAPAPPRVVADAPAAAPPAPKTAAVPLPTPMPVPAVPPASPPDASLIDSISNSPYLLPGAGILAVLLAGFGAWRLRGRMGKSVSETSFLESRMQPDSFFGASGGQHVDTRESSRTSASSMGYSLSQLDAIGDVDPVAEADVYLAYGRDLQAEEILKEAMRTTPDRLAVRTKLLEVYAKRRDIKGFELLATQLYSLTKGVGPDWARAQELGRQCDSDNQLYHPGGHPEEIILDGQRVVLEPLGATTQPHSVQSAPTQPFIDSRLPQLGGGTLDLELDLDLNEPDDGAAQRAMEATRPLAASLQRPPPAIDTTLDFDMGDHTMPVGRTHPMPMRTVAADLDLDSLTMDLDDGKGDTTVTMAMNPPGRGGGGAGSDTTLDFSRFPVSQPGTLSGPLSDTAPTTPGDLDDMTLDTSDPLARKLELAEEFRQIGDTDGARDLLEEVVSKASGTLRAKAQSMLDKLG